MITTTTEAATATTRGPGGPKTTLFVPGNAHQPLLGRPRCRLGRHRCHDDRDLSAWPPALWYEPGGARAPAFRAGPGPRVFRSGCQG